MIDVGAALTRKIGPLPAVAWGGIIGGGVLVARFLRGGGSGGSSAAPTIVGAVTDGEPVTGTPTAGPAVGLGSSGVSGPLPMDWAAFVAAIRGDGNGTIAPGTVAPGTVAPGTVIDTTTDVPARGVASKAPGGR